MQRLARPLIQPPVPTHNRVRTESGSCRQLQPGELVAGCERCLELGAIRSNLRPWEQLESEPPYLLTWCFPVALLLGLPTPGDRECPWIQGTMSPIPPLSPLSVLPTPSCLSLSPSSYSHCVCTLSLCLCPWNATCLPAGHLVGLAHSPRDPALVGGRAGFNHRSEGEEGRSRPEP